MQYLNPVLFEGIKVLQREMLQLEQVEVPVRHYYANGFYAREMQVLAGVTLVGKIHKSEHLCIIQKGKVKIVSEEFNDTVTGPFTYVSQPGAKRAMHVLEDLVFTTVHMTDETDLDVLEDLLIESEPELQI